LIWSSDTCADHPALHSFPTRRSSDLLTVKGIRCLSIAVLSVIACFSPIASYSQNSNVSIGTESLKDQAILWLKGNGNQGLLLPRSEEHTSELQSRENLVCRLLLEKKK